MARDEHIKMIPNKGALADRYPVEMRMTRVVSGIPFWAATFLRPDDNREERISLMRETIAREVDRYLCQ